MTPDGRPVPARGLGGWLARAAPRAARGEVTVALVSDGRMRTLNRSFRGTDGATDVLSFRVGSVEGGSTYGSAGQRAERCLGDIVIATGVARRQASQAHHSVGTELRMLALHGLLHLLGYDHETDTGEMARAEARLRKKAGLKEGGRGR